MPQPDASDPTPRPPRRKRYVGRNPRSFQDKYKELRLDPATLAKVTASGTTPAGTPLPGRLHVAVRRRREALGDGTRHLLEAAAAKQVASHLAHIERAHR